MKILSFTEKVRVFKTVRNFFMDGVSVGKYLGEHSVWFSLGEMVGSGPVRIRENGIWVSKILRSRGYVRGRTSSSSRLESSVWKVGDEAGKMAWGQAGCWIVVQCHAKNLVPDTEKVPTDSGKRSLRPSLCHWNASKAIGKIRDAHVKLSGTKKPYINFLADGLGRNSLRRAESGKKSVG